MSAQAILIGMERASRAMRSHSVELDRHSFAESIDHTVGISDAKSTPFVKRCPQFENWGPVCMISHFGAVVVI
jgi:hypothetical protein